MSKTSVHLIGIGGSGLSAIGRVLLEKGYSVSGSDRQMTPFAQQLQAIGATVHIGHRPENIQGANLVIRSSAIADTNSEVQAALNAGIPVLKRSEFLERLTEGQRTIAIAGTHGKTTTTSMVTWLLQSNDLDPSFMIGGVPKNLGVNAHAGQGHFFVIEADEYDRMFLGLKPEIGVITNIEYDHPDCFPTQQDFYQAFRDFAQAIIPSGFLIMCSDDVGAARLIDEVKTKHTVETYGLSTLPNNMPPYYFAKNLKQQKNGAYSFKVYKNREPLIVIELQVPGKHNVLNALACVAVANLVGIPPENTAKALGEFLGTGRRFDVRGEASGITLIDDYAHHPSEIRATLSTARAAFPNRRLWAVWQPHTYSRVLALWDEFATAFWDADVVLMLDVYAARERKPSRFSARDLARQINHPEVNFIEDNKAAITYLQGNLRNGDVLVVLSAGDADQINNRLLELLTKKREVG